MSTSPGPWRWVVEKPYGVTVTTLVDATGKVLICAEEEGGDCCDCTAVLDPPDPEDAALIAAAPELAELLAWALQVIDDDLGWDNRDAAEVRRARELLAALPEEDDGG